MSWRRRAVGIPIAGAIVLGVLAGCAPGPAANRETAASVVDTAEQSVADASSAVATAQLVVDLFDAGRLPAATTDVALGDAVATADGAAHSLATAVVPDQETLQLRDQALTVVTDAAVAISAARTWVAGGLPGEDVSAQLFGVADALEAATAAVAEAGGS